MEQQVSSESPVKLEISYPESSSRGLALCALLGIKALILIPVLVMAYIFEIVAMFAMIGGLFAALFTAKYPKGIFDFNVRILKWMVEINAYYLSMSDKYPPIVPR